MTDAQRTWLQSAERAVVHPEDAEAADGWQQLARADAALHAAERHVESALQERDADFI